MKLTAVIAAAVLAYTASSAPVTQHDAHEITSTIKHHKYKYPFQQPSRKRPIYDFRKQGNRPRPHRPVGMKAPPVPQADGDVGEMPVTVAPNGKPASMKAIPRSLADEELGPIPVSVAPNGFIVPASNFQPSSLTGGALEDPFHISEIAKSDSQESVAHDKLESRAVMWKPNEISNYHVGVKIDIKNSIVELKDKLDYLNARGLVTVSQANQRIDELANVIASRLRLNFVANDPKFNEMLTALREHVVSAIGNQNASVANAPLTEAQQAEQDTELANLHAHYILKGLQEKLLLLARAGKLDKRLGNISITQARQIIKATPALSQKDLDAYEVQLKLLENAVPAMVKKKLSDIPATAVSLMPVPDSPLKSDFKLPGEDNPSIEPFVEEFASEFESTEFTDETPSATANIEKRSAWSITPVTILSHVIKMWNYDSPHPKRDTNTTVVNITTTPTPAVSHEGSFWIDYGAPECVNIIMDEDLDQAKLAQFESCEDKFEPEVEEPSDSEELHEAEKAEKGSVEAREAEKHSYEIETDESEWGRGVIN
ncbi:hypothetical protein VTL71DRAFT_6121 [Oculimacula yallundae]|uniref:Uncharacterized protein n=1 Tax=Oculimacula yallundae TaxID=86028 RepID=A0ABR4C151_9HELO